MTIGNHVDTSMALNDNLYHNSLPRFLLANTQSIQNKIDELEAIVVNNSVDIACITESWLNDDVATQLVNLSGYTCYRRDRQDGRRGGGVACYVRNNLVPLKHLEVADVESMWFLYRTCKMPRLLSHIAVGVIYHPPKSEEQTCNISHTPMP
jgi:hypothetical protein